MKNKLYVGNLNYAATSDDLTKLFSEHWQVTDCRVIDGKGFAFITFSDEQSANDAKEKMNNQEFMGRSLKIDIAVDNRSRDFRPGGGGGGGKKFASKQRRF